MRQVLRILPRNAITRLIEPCFLHTRSLSIGRAALSSSARALAESDAPSQTKIPKPQTKGNTLLPPRPKLVETDITEVFLCGSGPGGQKINKTASAVQLTHLPTGIVLKCQATRSRIQNRKIARELLAEKIELMEKGSESRAAVKGERKVRKKKSADKKKRRKYRALEADKTSAEEDDAEADGRRDEDESINSDIISGRSPGAGAAEPK